MRREKTPHLAAWPARPSATFTSTLICEPQLLDAERLEEHGFRTSRDAHRVAVYGGVEIWHTELVSARECPYWPPGRDGARLVYRGFDFDKLAVALSAGLDYRGSGAFFGSTFEDKAWEYPPSREVAAVLIFDGHRLEPSWAIAGPGVDPTGYACTYVDEGREIHTRFPRGRGTRTFADEASYGYFAPGNPREALLGVLIGSAETDCRRLLPDLPGLVFDPVPDRPVP
ncbi:hypothetical protein AXK56_16735 [Tsukamurella pulmonis]|uniref:Uncharacterized protein n=1 Tax=Tsukamurella pulmonis TaxID=47312 RepID=A0A1H1AC59_9ACTN|nr:hypothetical protein [Tsukamurella pulmonis]KXO95856.1 hypothetical protein AXK56_16735 [Tsukamurella pulmonis]SDQ37328.1 hypothetical protein SAMN04489765_0157 [Tsukamurella pulmonis]SUQ39379.1 Uncharacterised protein [Tsukamurella pulmonis]